VPVAPGTPLVVAVKVDRAAAVEVRTSRGRTLRSSSCTHA
jgi:hypothetical protein